MSQALQRSQKNYLRKATDRASIHEQRSRNLANEKIHLEMSLQAALAKIRELETALKMASEVIEHWKGIAS